MLASPAIRALLQLLLLATTSSSRCTSNHILWPRFLTCGIPRPLGMWRTSKSGRQQITQTIDTPVCVRRRMTREGRQAQIVSENESKSRMDGNFHDMLPWWTPAARRHPAARASFLQAADPWTASPSGPALGRLPHRTSHPRRSSPKNPIFPQVSRPCSITDKPLLSPRSSH